MKADKVSMRSNKSVRSFKSVRSAKSIPGDIIQLEEHLIKACKKFQCPYAVTVQNEYQFDEPTVKTRKITMVPPPKEIVKDDLNIDGDKTSAMTCSEDENSIKVTAVYDNTNSLVEIALNNVKEIPRVLIKTICLLIPFFEQFAKISIQRCRLDPYTIYEINKILPVATITDLCFDSSPFKEANYAILLESKTLSSLSLSRCKINDEVCKQIASKLHFSMPVENSLKTLNLSSNYITNEGAKDISEALRSNRHLRYLNLADNHIDDVGAAFIFDSLKEFPMTSDEIISKRRRCIKYLKLKQDMYSTYLQELKMTSNDATSQFGRKSVQKKMAVASLKTKSTDKKNYEKNKMMVTDDCLSAKAELFAAEVMGPFRDPFNSANIEIQNGNVCSNGNMVLCYLNLSYNNLSYFSVKKLLDVVIYQSKCTKSNQTGLIRAVIEGNALPEKCDEMMTISNLLAKSIVTRVQFNKLNTVKQRQSRGTKSINL